MLNNAKYHKQQHNFLDKFKKQNYSVLRGPDFQILLHPSRNKIIFGHKVHL